MRFYFPQNQLIHFWTQLLFDSLVIQKPRIDLPIVQMLFVHLFDLQLRINAASIQAFFSRHFHSLFGW